jgi:hypothetical protein
MENSDLASSHKGRKSDDPKKHEKLRRGCNTNDGHPHDK